MTAQGPPLVLTRTWFRGAVSRCWALSMRRAELPCAPPGSARWASFPGRAPLRKHVLPTGFAYAGSVAISGALAGSPAPLVSGAEPPTLDESSSSGSLFATVGSRSSTPQHPPLLAQPRNCGSASPAPQLCASPRLGTQGPLPDTSKGDLPSEAGFSDPESEAKRRIVFTISAGSSSAKQSPSSKHSPLSSGARGDGGQSHGQDSRKRGRRKRAAAGTPGFSSGVSPKRRALPSVAGLFTQSSGSPLNLNSMVRLGVALGAVGPGRSRGLLTGLCV